VIRCNINLFIYSEEVERGQSKKGKKEKEIRIMEKEPRKMICSLRKSNMVEKKIALFGVVTERVAVISDTRFKNTEDS
jgi:hypothetical protein